tara:strand:+ start:438 stop:665 length:228 start_codon:yes stop_codon:yes gene_type:complete
MATITITNDDGTIYAKYNTDKVLWQILEKKHIAENMRKKDWLDLVYQNNKWCGFADEVSKLGREFVQEYTPSKFD